MSLYYSEIPGHYGCYGAVYTTEMEIVSPCVTSSVVMACVSDLHLRIDKNGEVVGQRNALLATDAIAYRNPHAILITGDIIDDPQCLENGGFCIELINIFKKMADGRLVIVEWGEHDIATLDLKTGKYCPANLNRLKDILSNVDNVVFLDDVESYCLSENSKSFGFEGAHVNFVGGRLPWDYYFNNSESPEAFKEHLENRIGAGSCFKDDAINVLAMHTIGSFIELYHELHFAKQVNLSFTSHRHNGFLTNGLAHMSPGYFSTGRGLVNSTGDEFFPLWQYGSIACCTKTCGTVNNLIGGPVNMVVKYPWVNDLLAPNVGFVTFNPRRYKTNKWEPVEGVYTYSGKIKVIKR